MPEKFFKKIKTVLVSDLNKKPIGYTRNSNTNSNKLPFKVEVTPEYKHAFHVLDKGCLLVFITGRAGTGKSTFIHYFRKKTNKRIAVVAPTGVAALNVGGQTIHSFFHFPPRILNINDITRVRNKILYEKLDILIVDEASMLRADLLDAIDKFLRINSLNSSAPFGGVQLILIGDLFQLPPVCNNTEKEILSSKGYETPYFFSAECIQTCQLAFIELTKIYRQENENFIQLLNCIREGIDPNRTIEKINEVCYKKPKDDENINITLTCTNKKASQINHQRLSILDALEYKYKGHIVGQFRIQEDRLPSPYILQLKVGAKVMFTKNDDQHRWVNGTIGKVTELSDDIIKVKVRNDILDVNKVKWETIKYKYDRYSDKIIAKVIGKYTQYPLMLAWAITIHKSQGKTLKNVCIDLGNGAFAFGQTYVALSRCPTIHDINLKNPLNLCDIKVDPKIQEVYNYLRTHS